MIFSTIYASNDILDRNILWDNLKNITNYYKGPWMVGGNFNEIIDSRDKFGGRHKNQRRANSLINCLNYCNLVDIELKGCKYTWSNHC